MARNTTSFPKNRPMGDGIFLRQIKTLAESWLLAGDISRHSKTTLSARRGLIGRLCWFLESRELEYCDTHALRQFFKHILDGHREPGGCWGNPQNTRPTKPRTSATYDRILRTFFSRLVEEGEIESSPMERIKKPIDRPDEVNPFSEDQLFKLLAAAKKTHHPKRDEAILLLMLDTGIRVSELCVPSVPARTSALLQMLAERVGVLEELPPMTPDGDGEGMSPGDDALLRAVAARFFHDDRIDRKA